MELLPLDYTVFYNIEKAIKTYRKFAQKAITAKGFDITIDQWLLLKVVKENPELTQQRIADRLFKDYASVTRIVQLLVEKKYIERSLHSKDRRRFSLALTEHGNAIIKDLWPVIINNRKTALETLTNEDINQLNRTLKIIADNCKS